MNPVSSQITQGNCGELDLGQRFVAKCSNDYVFHSPFKYFIVHNEPYLLDITINAATSTPTANEIMLYRLFSFSTSGKR